MPVLRFIHTMERNLYEPALYEPPDAEKIESELRMPSGLILGAPLLAAILLVLAIIEMPH